MADIDSKNFLSRWARRKLVATLNRQSGAKPNPAGSPQANPQTDSDDELRRLALRILFTEPQFAARDGLDDYDGDYTFFEAHGDLLTQDMLRALERAEKMRADATPKETDEDSAPESGVA